MEVTELGMVTLVSPVQLRNALDPIEVTELGIVTEVILDPLTKEPGRVRTSFPIVTLSILDVVILPVELQYVAFHVKYLIPVQLWNA